MLSNFSAEQAYTIARASPFLADKILEGIFCSHIYNSDFDHSNVKAHGDPFELLTMHGTLGKRNLKRIIG
jgi:hypothetical protein